MINLGVFVDAIALVIIIFAVLACVAAGIVFLLINIGWTATCGLCVFLAVGWLGFRKAMGQLHG